MMFETIRIQLKTFKKRTWERSALRNLWIEGLSDKTCKHWRCILLTRQGPSGTAVAIHCRFRYGIVL